MPTRDRRQEIARPTALHKFYSETRDEWISAEDLRPGENIRSLGGPLQVVSLRAIPGTHRVYNMTVEGEHVYHVSTLGVLAHNNNCAMPTPTTRAVDTGHYPKTPGTGVVDTGYYPDVTPTTPHTVARGGNKTAAAPKTGRPNSIHEQVRPNGSRSVTYYDDHGRAFSREDYGQLRTHGTLGRAPDGNSVPHEHRILYSDKGPIGKQYRELGTDGTPVGPWYDD